MSNRDQLTQLTLGASVGHVHGADYDPATFALLKTIDDPRALRALERRQLGQLADELRAFILESVSRTGGHLSSNLGTVELAIQVKCRFRQAIA